MAVERFETRNSVYEIDQDEKRIRRVSGANPPTPNQGDDGAWQPYVRIFPYGASGSLFVELPGRRGIVTSPVDTDLTIRDPR